MKHNLMIISNNYNLSKKLAEVLADYFSMRVLDEIELLKFDFLPNTIENLILSNGEEFVLKKLSKNAISQCEFENVVFISHLETVDFLTGEFEIIKENDFVIFVNCKDTDFDINIEKFVNLFEIQKISNDKIDFYKNNLADLFIEIEKVEIEDLTNVIIEKIKKYYNIA